MRFKAVFFDFMGTCLDWHTSVSNALPSSLSREQKSDLALRWRQNYFDAAAARYVSGKSPEDIDITIRSALKATLDAGIVEKDQRESFSAEAIDSAIRAWHNQPAWPEVAPALADLKSQGLELFVHANGTTRLQLDLIRPSGLQFDLLMSSQMLGIDIRDTRAFERALELVKLRREEVVKVACHANDLRTAKRAGLKTVYVKRWTDDIEEDMEKVEKEFDRCLDGFEGLREAVRELGAGV
jgi:2-haloalkanoic acid dehalogenase type II